MPQIIDADTHVLESEPIWEYFRRDAPYSLAGGHRAERGRQDTVL
jgi:hypothetical protein